MSGNGHNGLLMILLALDPLIKPYDVLASDHVVFTEQALTAFVSRSAKEASK